jgi:restriction system protein
MTPTEFERFVRQLFEASGLEGWTTERTGDDGVDARSLGWRTHNCPGQEIQRRNFGVSHIRELVGAMDEKRAGRGSSSQRLGSRAGAG